MECTTKSISLLDQIKESIPDLKNTNYQINLMVYDAMDKKTLVLSNKIKKNDSNLYADNTYKIVYDPRKELPSEKYIDCYYATTFNDLISIISFIKSNQKMYSSKKWCYDELSDDITGMFEYKKVSEMET